MKKEDFKDEIMYNKTEKKVLIAAPIGGKKQYSINEWFNWIANQDYKNYDVCMCVNGKHRLKLFSMLKQVEIKDIHNQIKYIHRLMLVNSDKLTVIQNITFSREKIRRYAVKEGYDAVFWLDTDTIPANTRAIEQLLQHDKDSISGLYFYKNSKVSVIIDKDTHTNFSMEKIKLLVDKNEICKIWGSGYGCLLHQRKALTIAYDYDLFGEERTDDFGHSHALEQAEVMRWFYPMVICKHFANPDEQEKINKYLGINNHKINKEQSLNNLDGKNESGIKAKDQGMDNPEGDTFQDVRRR